MLVYLNGSFVAAQDAHVPVTDRGFIFGDGVYEVWRIVRGAPFEWSRHHARLEHGLSEMAIPRPPEVAPERLGEIARKLLTENNLLEGEASLYLQVTRGAAPRTHFFPPAGTVPTMYVTARAFTPPQDLRASGVTGITQPDVRWLRCNIKTIQLLPNVLANEKAHAAGAAEALFIREGVITEGTHANAFGVVDGVLRTHPTTDLILPGVTREVVLELATELGFEVREEPIAVAEIPKLQELFVTGTTTDVLPIVQLDGTPVGTGRPGPIAQALLSALRARLDAAASGSFPGN